MAVRPSPPLTDRAGGRTIAASVALAPLLLGPHREGRLLGASQAAVYLGFGDGEGQDVVALVPPSSVRLPLAIVVAGTLPPIAGNPVVELGGGVVRVGTGEWAPARWFDPRPRNLTTPDPGRVTAAARVLWEVPAAEIGLDAARAEAAVAALVAGEAEPACKVLGAGPGLTPAGDDVLAGALSACALIGPATALRAAPEFLARARGATTSLSAALLSCAAAGQVIPQAASFLSALCGTGDVASALAELRSIGATSGTALAVGIVAALDSGRTGRSLAVTQ